MNVGQKRTIGTQITTGKQIAWRLVACLALLATTLASPISSLAAPSEQGTDPEAKARALLDTLTPEERVGQLFLVTFTGAGASPESQIYDLIANYHIGGVMLRRENDNFIGAPDTVAGAVELTSALQSAEAASSESRRPDATSGEVYTPAYIPLFIGISEEGDGYPNDQILEGLSPLPSAMTLGATWDPALAQQAGNLLGSELTSIGINLLLGPSLDVLYSPRPESLGDLGVRSFGGDPFWVGQMGKAFITGIHEGSQNQVAVIAKHLPGHGGSDRPVDEEVPTVRKSLSELTQIELPPFFAVTGDATSTAARTDGMLLAHIRYQGFQGNIRATTRPISFDSQAFAQLMALPQFANWRGDGGVIVSDNLGARAIRRNYDPSEETFNSPLVARDAFLAGNDLLYLGNFRANTDPDAYTSIIRTAQFFAQKYREDQAFAERVDESALRILTLKFKLYSDFDAASVNEEALAFTPSANFLFEVGRRAATLLSPSSDELANLLPEPPGQFEQIVFLTDSIEMQQCSQCPRYFSMSPTALAEAVLSLYGPDAGNLTTAANLVSFSFSQLARTLDATWPEGEDPVVANLQRAEWVVFVLGRQDARPESLALRRLLSERPDLLQDKKVIVFALNAPYYLDATDITKITAYYALYSKEEGMPEIAARLLFQEISAPGKSSVSIEGVGYDLVTATAPDETQIVPMTVQRILPAPIAETATATSAEAQQTAEPTAIPTYQAGDLLGLSAGPILDHNGHIVPDNTPVTFGITIVTEGATLTRTINAVTRQGMAQSSYSIEDEGSLEIVAASGDPAARSAAQHFDVIGINPEGLALQATQTAQAQLQATASAMPLVQTINEPVEPEPIQTGLTDWLLITMVAAVSGLFAYQTGVNLGRSRWAVRWALTTLIGGLAIGTYLAFDLPGSQAILSFSGEWGVVLTGLAGAALGWMAGWGWHDLMKNRQAKPGGSVPDRSDKT